MYLNFIEICETVVLITLHMNHIVYTIVLVCTCRIFYIYERHLFIIYQKVGDISQIKDEVSNYIFNKLTLRKARSDNTITLSYIKYLKSQFI